MKQLFEVKTKKYKYYYVLADGYDNAKTKVEDKIIEENSESIFDKEGSLKKEIEFDEVEIIKIIGNKFIL